MNIDITELLTKQPILLFDGECGFATGLFSFFTSGAKIIKAW